MKCEEYKISVNSFVDESLDTEEQVNLFKHLSDCPECRLFLDSIVKTRNLIRSENIMPPPELDDEIFSEINRRKMIYNKSVKKERASFWDWHFTVRAPFAAAIVILLIAIGMFFYNGFSRKFEMLEAQKISFINNPENIPVKYIIVTEMPEIEVLGNPKYTKKINSAIYNK